MKNIDQLFKCIFPILITVLLSYPLLSQEDPPTECPYFNIYGVDSTGLSFTLESTTVDAEISGVISNVNLTQTYINAGDSTVNASYIFPMSSKAAVYSMQMQVNNRIIDAIIKRKDEAQTIFNNATNDGLTASLLEQERPNVFQMSLANINPGDTIRVRMKYTELLVPEGGAYQFVFPSVVAPRYTTDGEPWVPQSVSDAAAVANSALDINLKIKAGTYVSASSKSHTVEFETQGINTVCQLSTNPGPDFIVDYTFAREELESSLLLHEGEEENFFLSIIHPPRPDIDYPLPPREYVFIMDVSGSMTGTPLDISKELITNLLEDLDATDKFNIIFFAGSSSSLSPNSLQATATNIGMATDFLTEVEAEGGTKLLPALTKALAMTGTEDYSRTFVISTDGGVTVEKEAFELIRNNLNTANFFSFGIGTSVNRYIIEGLAYVGEGEAFTIADYQDADVISERFKNYINRPALTNIVAEFDGIDVYEVEPLTIPDVFAERPIILYGKYNGPAQGRIKLTGDFGNAGIESTLAFTDPDPNNEALKYLWARKKIRLMSDYGIASNENDTISIEEEITLLGLKYSLVTEFTSFVAVDSNAIAQVPTDNPPNGGGGIAETDDLVDTNQENEIYFKLLGTIIDNDRVVRLKLLDNQVKNNNNYYFKIFDMNGQLIKTQNVLEAQPGGIIKLNMNNLPTGLYSISLLSKNKILETKKFIVTS